MCRRTSAKQLNYFAEKEFQLQAMPSVHLLAGCRCCTLLSITDRQHQAGENKVLKSNRQRDAGCFSEPGEMNV
jgi:hypothetical protein